MASIIRNRFYPHIALAMALFIIVGFSRTYYLRFLFELPPLRTLVLLHGAAFTAWMLLFVAQTRLIATHRVDLHRKVGIAGLALAVLVVLIGFLTTIGNAAIPRIRPSGLSPSQFSIFGFTSLALFSIFIGLGIAFRRRAALHKRFMVLAMIAVLNPPAARLLAMLGLRDQSTFLVPFFSAAFVTWCLVHDWRRHRIVHPAFALGGLLIVVSWPLRTMIGRSEFYQPVAEWVARMSAGIYP